MESTSNAAARAWLDVPYAEKDEAKAAGARWDPQARCWFAPRPGMTELARWAPLPDLLPGEDRGFGSGLFVDLIPASCWFTNVRSCVADSDWDRLRGVVYRRAGQRCEACGAQRDAIAKLWLEAHERWDYDEAHSVQTLRRLVCLCTRCHEVTHFGRAQVMGNDERALRQLMRVNGWKRDLAEWHVRRAFDDWEDRNRRNWDLDLSMLTDAGITLALPPAAGRRREIAAAALGGAEAADAAQPSAATGLPSPGWFGDPAGRFEHRWWDGAAWTSHVATAGVQSQYPL